MGGVPGRGSGGVGLDAGVAWEAGARLAGGGRRGMEWVGGRQLTGGRARLAGDGGGFGVDLSGCF